MKQHYQKHLFFCVNQKDSANKCCAQADAEAMSQYFKLSLLEKGLHGPDKFRVSTSGCLGRCRKGPCLVVYPDGIWYSYSNKQDLDKIIEQHLLGGTVVKELLID